MKTNKNKKESKKLSQEKIVINSITDLLKIPLNKIHNSKIENFSGEYFDKIYEEVIKNESQPLSNETDINNKDLNQNKKEIDLNTLKSTNKNIQKKDNNSINIIKPYYEEEMDIPKNKYRLEYKKNKNIKNNQKDEDTEDNDDENFKKNDFDTVFMTPPPPQENPKRKNSPIKINKIIFSVNYNSKFGEEVAILGSLAKFGLWELSGALPLKWNEGNIWTGEIIVEDEDWRNFEFKFIVVEKGKIKFWESGENNIINFDELIKNILSNKIGRYNKYKYEYNKNDETLSIKCHWHY